MELEGTQITSDATEAKRNSLATPAPVAPPTATPEPTAPLGDPTVDSPEDLNNSTILQPNAVSIQEDRKASQDIGKNQAKNSRDILKHLNDEQTRIKQAKTIRAAQFQDVAAGIQKNIDVNNQEIKKISQEFIKKSAEQKKEMKVLIGQKVDMGRFFQNQSTFQKIMWTIAVALDGYNSGYNGTENHTLNRIQKLVELDVNAQQVQRKHKLDALKQTGADLKDERNFDLKNLLEVKKGYNDRLNAVLAALEESGKQYDSQSVQAMNMAKFQQTISKNQATNLVSIAKTLNALNTKEREQTVNATINNHDTQIIFRNKELANNFSKQNADGKSTIKAIDHIEVQLKRFSKLSGDIAAKLPGWDGELRKEYQRLGAALQTDFGAVVGKGREGVVGPGVLSDTDIAILKKVFGTGSFEAIGGWKDMVSRALTGENFNLSNTLQSLNSVRTTVYQTELDLIKSGADLNTPNARAAIKALENNLESRRETKGPNNNKRGKGQGTNDLDPLKGLKK